MGTGALVDALRAAQVSPTDVDLAEALWLAQYVDVPARPAGAAAGGLTRSTGPVPDLAEPGGPTGGAGHGDPDGAAVYPRLGDERRLGDLAGGMDLRGPRVAALRGSLALGRVLRQARRTVLSERDAEVDEAKTADLIAQEGLWVPVMAPKPEPESDLALVVDTSASMLVWDRTVHELLLLFQRLAAFRGIRTYGIDSDQELTLLPLGAAVAAPIPPASIVDPTGRRLTLVVTDAVGAAWHDGRMDTLLQRWGAVNRLQVLSVLPRRMWRSTGLRTTTSDGRSGDRVAVPVVELSLAALARRAAALGEADGAAILQPPPPPVATEPVDDPVVLVRRFLNVASPTAQQLAGYLAATPLTLPTMRLIQQALLPASDTTHLAEVFVSGLLQRSPSSVDTDVDTDVDGREFELAGGVRDLLLDRTDRFDAIEVLSTLTQFVTDRLGQALDFPALLLHPDEAPIPDLRAGMLPIARLTATVVRGLGPRYAALANRLERAAEGAATAVGPTAGGTAGTTAGGTAGTAARRTAAELVEAMPIRPAVVSSRPAAPTDGGEPAPESSSTDPLFYLSYARAAPLRGVPISQGDPNRRVQQLFADLSGHVNNLVYRETGADPGYMDLAPHHGELWRRELLHAVGTCQVFVALLSPTYLKSEHCAQEWNAFTQRPVRGRDETSQHPATSERPTTSVIPVVWSPPHRGTVPEAVRNIQRFVPGRLPYPDVAQAYTDEGLYGLLSLRVEGTDAVILRLAQHIVDVAQRNHVERRVLPDLLAVPRTFT